MNMKLIKDENLLNKLDKNKAILIAVSTGIDSMCLFDYLYKLGYNLKVCHVNHKRRAESEDEYLYLKNYLKELNVPLFYYEINEKIDSNFQEKAREIRYNFFINTAKENNIDQIVTAHHEDDLIETILYRLTRGTISDGYLGIKEESVLDGIRIIRPLIYTSRDEINNYQKEFKIKFFEDSSNSENHYTRNKIRHNVIPSLKEINPKLNSSIINYRNDLKDLIDLAKDEASSFIKNNAQFKKNEVTVSMKEFNNQKRAVKKEVIKSFINYISSDSLELMHERLEEILSLNDNDSKDIEIGKNYMVSLSCGMLAFYKKEEIKDIEIVFDSIKDIKTKEFNIKLSPKVHLMPNKLSYLLCYNNLNDIFPIKVRRIKPGDKIKLGNVNKNIFDILMEEKIEKRNRLKTIVFLDKNNEIFFVPGYARKSTDQSLKNKIYICVEIKNEN